MKKIIFVLFIFILTSCAGNHGIVVYPLHIQERPHVEIYNKLLNCMDIAEGTMPEMVYIDASNKPNAWVDINNKMTLTVGLFKFDDDVLRFAMAHEMAHVKLKHVKKTMVISYATTGVFVVANAFVPGIGVLNQVINPAVVSNFSKPQELDADKYAAEVCKRCFDMSDYMPIHALKILKLNALDSGGFWDNHPSWDERIKNLGY